MSTEIDLRAQLRNRRRQPVSSEIFTPSQSETSSSASTMTSTASGRALPNLILSIDSLITFVQYLSAFPDKVIENIFASFETTAGLMFNSNKQTTVLGVGASFEVQAEQGERVPDELKQFPTLMKEKPRAVAIKVPIVRAGDDNKFDRTKEASCLRAIAWECHVLSHPPIRKCENIVDFYGLTWRTSFTGEDCGARFLPALVMELSDEGALTELFNPEWYSLSYALKWKLALDIAQGLDVLHHHGIIHGDIKAENILLFSNAEGGLTAKVTDFGFSIHDYNSDKSMSADFRGRSPPWDAPEVSEGKSVSLSELYQADLYSYGLLVWRLMLDGQTPFNISDESKSFPGFEQIAEVEGNERRLAMAELKMEPNDKFLSLVKMTLCNKGLNEVQLSILFGHTLRFDPKSRIASFKVLVSLMKQEDLGSITTQISTKALNQEDQQLADPLPFDILRDEFQAKRAFYGTTTKPRAEVTTLLLHFYCPRVNFIRS
jgi:serine/threonine protein kinase